MEIVQTIADEQYGLVKLEFVGKFVGKFVFNIMLWLFCFRRRARSLNRRFNFSANKIL